MPVAHIAKPFFMRKGDSGISQLIDVVAIKTAEDEFCHELPKKMDSNTIMRTLRTFVVEVNY